jgi:hypothetical protein
MVGMVARLCIVLSCLPLALLGGCSSGSQAAKCVPGASAACACPAGQQGAQTCTAAGTFQACQCSVPDAATVGSTGGNGGQVETTTGGISGTGGKPGAGGNPFAGGGGNAGMGGNASGTGGNAGMGGNASGTGGNAGTGGNQAMGGSQSTGGCTGFGLTPSCTYQTCDVSCRAKLIPYGFPCGPNANGVDLCSPPAPPSPADP